MRRFYIDDDGYLQSALDVTPQEVASRIDLVEEPPPEPEPGHFVRRVQGQWVQEPTSVRAQAQLEAVPLERAKTEAKRAIDEAAESARGRYLSPGSGQALEYEAAAREADLFLRSGPGGRAHFPMLQADVDAGLAPDLRTAAEKVAAARDLWEGVGAMIRKWRLEAKRQIEVASTHAQVTQIRDGALRKLPEPNPTEA